MVNLHAQHSKGWAGLAFVVLLVASVVLTGAPPAANAAPDAIGSYIASHRQGLLIAGWLAFPLGAFFLWFVVGISAYLRRTSAVDEGLPTYALALGIFAVAAAWCGAGVLTAMAFTPAGGASPFVWSLQSLLHGAFLEMALALFVFACAHSMRRHGSAPAWVSWLGYLAALAQAVQTFGVFYPTGVATDNQMAALVCLALFAVWMVVVSFHMIAGVGAKEQAGVTSAA